MKVKRNRKLMSILLTLSLLVTLLVPMVGPASASTTYTATSTPTLNAGTIATVGNLLVNIDPGTFAGGTGTSYVWLSAPTNPDNYGIGINGFAVGAYTHTGGQYTLNVGANAGIVPAQVGTVANQVYTGAAAQVMLVANDTDLVTDNATTGTAYFKQMQLVVNKVGLTNTANDGLVILPMAVDIPSGANGTCDVKMTATGGSGFTSGSVTIAKVGTSTVDVACESTETITGSGSEASGVISLKESSTGGLKTVKLTLPPGLTWNGSAPVSFNKYWAPANLDATNFTWDATANGGRELDITAKAANGIALTSDGYFNSTSTTYIKFKFNIDVDDSIAKEGDINLSISGDNVNTSSLLIGTYGTYGVTIKTLGDPTTVTAGKADSDSSKLGKFEIDETTKASLRDGRTVTLTLPSGAVWAYSDTPSLDSAASTKDNVSSVTWAASGSDGRTLKGTVNINNPYETANAAKLIFKDAKILVAPDFSGDLNVTVGGTQGLTGTLKLATVVAPVTATVASKPDVKIGMAGQSLGDVTITEAGASYLDASIKYAGLDTYASPGTPSKLGVTDNGANTGAELILTAPSGVKFDDVPTITVSDGDIQLDTSGITTTTSVNNEGQLVIPVKSSSTKASTIKISGIKVTVDRTVPEGAVSLKLQGTAVNECTKGGSIDVNDTALFPNSDTAFKLQVANVVTPAPGATKATAVFKIGDTKFTLNGVDQTMDAAPYLKDDRTYLPLRFVAKAVGVADSNIIWNSADQSVVLIKDGSVVKLTIGSNIMNINGTAITMDVAPEIVDPGRTMLPVRWVAQALGANIQWDNATQTVTVN